MFEQNITLGPGTGTFASHSFEILIMLGVAFMLGLWLGWILWSRFKQQAEKMRLEFDSMSATVQALRTETDSLKSKMIDLEAANADLQSQLTLGRDETTFFRDQNDKLEERLKRLTEENRRLLIELGLAAPPDTTEEPDLEIIAPESSIQEAAPEEVTDETTLTAIPEETSPEADLETMEGAYLEPVEMEGMLLAGMQEPEEPEAALLTEPPAMELPEPEELEETTVSETVAIEMITPQTEIIDPPQVEEPEDFSAAYVFTSPHDNLKVVEGIGPKIEELLFKNDIHTYTDLARTPVHRLKDILAEAGPRYVMHDPGTWSAQALLAANGEWDNLKAYQEFLNAGKRPK